MAPPAGRRLRGNGVVPITAAATNNVGIEFEGVRQDGDDQRSLFATVRRGPLRPLVEDRRRRHGGRLQGPQTRARSRRRRQVPPSASREETWGVRTVSSR